MATPKKSKNENSSSPDEGNDFAKYGVIQLTSQEIQTMMKPVIRDFTFPQLLSEDTCNTSARDCINTIFRKTIEPWIGKCLTDMGRRKKKMKGFYTKMSLSSSISIGMALKNYKVKDLEISVIQTELKKKYNTMCNNANRLFCYLSQLLIIIPCIDLTEMLIWLYKILTRREMMTTTTMLKLTMRTTLKIRRIKGILNPSPPRSLPAKSLP
jgi:hypothetical protein